MKVFVALYDIESTSGGGQTVYRRLFRRHPEIEFTYPLDQESLNHPRPANVHGLAPGQRHVRNSEHSSLLLSCYCWARTLVNAIGERKFDVVEIPDFMSDFCLLPAALNRRGLHPTIAVSLHGRSSSTREWEWPPSGGPDDERRRLENLLYDQADVRYGISRSYLDDWARFSSRRSHFVDPLSWLAFPQAMPPVTANHPPNLYFIGRTERRKGPDLFINAVARIPRDHYRNGTIIGPGVPISAGVDSNTMLCQLIRERGLDMVVAGSRTSAELAQVFAGRSIVALPSRLDQLNLIALEALFSGCPTVIGTGAGVLRYLDEHFPQIPVTRFDIDDIDAAANSIDGLLLNYDVLRAELYAAVKDLPRSIDPPDLIQLYSDRDSDPSAAAALNEMYDEIDHLERTTRPTLVRKLKQFAARFERSWPWASRNP